MKSFTITGKVDKFPGKGGWFYVDVPKKYTKSLKDQRRAWGLYPITVHLGKTSWKSKLMLKKGGDFFIAIKKEVRKKENVIEDSNVEILINLE